MGLDRQLVTPPKSNAKVLMTDMAHLTSNYSADFLPEHRHAPTTEAMLQSSLSLG